LRERRAPATWKKELLASFNRLQKARNMRDGKGRIRAQDLGDSTAPLAQSLQPGDSESESQAGVPTAAPSLQKRSGARRSRPHGGDAAPPTRSGERAETVAVLSQAGCVCVCVWKRLGSALPARPGSSGSGIRTASRSSAFSPAHAVLSWGPGGMRVVCERRYASAVIDGRARMRRRSRGLPPGPNGFRAARGAATGQQ
jgi:hypothetical protein